MKLVAYNGNGDSSDTTQLVSMAGDGSSGKSSMGKGLGGWGVGGAVMSVEACI